METKSFDLETLLTVTTGRLLTDIGNLYEILGWMTDDEPYTHQLPRFGRECKPRLLELFPDLAKAGTTHSLERLDVLCSNESDAKVAVGMWLVWLESPPNNLAKAYDVPKLASEEHVREDPITELTDAVGSSKVVVVKSAQ